MSTRKAKKIDLKKLREIIDFVPHERQREVVKGQTRFTTLCWGRRSGKTKLAAYIALKYLLTGSIYKNASGNDEYRGHNIWIAAPTYDLAKRSWAYLTEWVPKINKALGQYIRINKSNFTMDCYSGSKLELKTTDNPASLLGSGLDLLIIDEAARVGEDIWQTYLRPTLTDRHGKAVFISTPFGKNWFYNMMLKGTDSDAQYKDYSYFHMKTKENTTIHDIEKEVETAKLELPMNEYLQEYEAEFIEGAGSVFRGVRDCLYSVDFRGFPFAAETYNEAHVYQGGLDLARLTDFTVETIVDKAQSKFKVIAIDRFNELDWKLQKPRISLLSEKYRNPPVHSEVNNIGDVVLGDLPGNFSPFKTTAESKKELINNLAILIEQKKILIPNIPVLVSELESYSYEVTSNGNIKYSAPTGYHDDMVMSLALACKDLKDPVASTPAVNNFTTPTATVVDNDW